MGAKEIGTSNDRKAWLEARRHGIGSSDAARILGLAPRGDLLSVWAEKAMPPEEQEPPQSEAMRWGLALEQMIAQRAAEVVRGEARPSGVLYQNESRSWQLATLDAWLHHRDTGLYPQTRRTPVECKMVAARARDWEDGPPAYVMAQARHQLATMEEPVLYVAALILVPVLRFELFEVERDTGFEDDVLHPAESEFWSLVESRTPPQTVASRYSLEAVRRIYSPKAGVSKVLGWDEAELATKLQEAREREREAKGEVEDALARVLMAMGEAEIGMLPDGRRITAKEQHRKGYTVAETTIRPVRVSGGEK